MKDFINPSINRKLDMLICHVGTNDVTNNIDTLTNLQTIINPIKKKSVSTKIVFSSVIQRHDQPNIEKKVSALNNELKQCDKNQVHYLCNRNVDETCLGKGKLHPNKKGKAFLAKNIINFVNNYECVYYCFNGETEHNRSDASKFNANDTLIGESENINYIEANNVCSVCPFIPSGGDMSETSYNEINDGAIQCKNSPLIRNILIRNESLKNISEDMLPSNASNIVNTINTTNLSIIDIMPNNHNDMSPPSFSYDTDDDDNRNLMCKRLSEIRAQNINKIIVDMLNINSIRNKFEQLVENINKSIFF